MKIKKNLYLLFWLIFGLFLFSFSSVFAGQNDCDIVKNDIKDLWSELDYTNLFPEDARIQALTNLKAYCCEKNILDKEDCKDEVFLYPYPESPFLFDHLLDVGMRRLDATAMYDLEPDMVGKEWRDSIREAAIDVDGKFASSIDEKYKKYRTLDKSDYSLSFDTLAKSQKLVEDRNVMLNLNIKYSSATLYQRYWEQCWIAYVLYRDVRGHYKKNFLIDDWFPICKEVVANRISNELEYTKTLVLQKSTKVLTDNIHVYLYDYFSKNRLMNLQETIFAIADLFTTIAKSFPWWTSECS